MPLRAITQQTILRQTVISVSLSTISWQPLMRQKQKVVPAANSYGFAKMSSVIDRWKPDFLFRRRVSVPLAPESRARRAVALKGTLRDTTSLLRILADGRIEVEYYERNAG